MRRPLLLLPLPFALALAGTPATYAADPATGTVSFATSADRQAGVGLAGSPTARRLTVRDVAYGIGAGVRLDGTLRLRAPSGSVASVGGLRLSLDRAPLRMSGVLGRRRVALLTVTPAAGRRLRVDTTTGAVALTGATLSLTAAGARALRVALRLRRAPRAGRLGRLSVAIPPRRVTVAPTPAPSVTPPRPTMTPGPAPTPAPTPTPTPTPTPSTTPDPCWSTRPAPDPDHVDWIACDRAGGGSLKSFISYLRTDWAAAGACTVGRHGVYPSDGATLIDASNPYDHRLAVAAVEPTAGGVTTVRLRGRLEYALDAHGIDQATVDPVLLVAADRASASVRVSGRSSTGGPGGACPIAPTPFTDVEALTLDLTQAASTVRGAQGTTFSHVPARLTADGAATLGSGIYPAGAGWGAFSFTVPTP